jgi:penicillin-binding protein 1C
VRLSRGVKQGWLLAIALTLSAYAGLALLFWPVDAAFLADQSGQSVDWRDRFERRLSEQVGPLGARSQPVTLAEVSPHFVNALLAAEDHRFFEHFGIDPRALWRAVWQNLRAHRVVSGGSTLTMQLARLLSSDEAVLAGDGLPSRSLWQKLREGRLALRLELSASKQQLLEAFVNRAPFGRGAIGVRAAAERVFGVGPDKLTLAQATYLAALTKGPSAFAATPERAVARQQHILGLMLARGAITQGQLERARQERLSFVTATAGEAAGLHAVDLARRVLVSAAVPIRGRVTLSIDLELEREVGRILAEQIPSVYSRGGRSGAAVVLDNESGEVRALVGAAFADNPRWGQFNAAIAARQPGSALKPFLYAAALSQGYTAASLASDIDRPYPDTWGVYMPENYDERFHGPVRFRESLAQSLNVAAVDVLFKTGLDNAFRLLDAVGLKTLDRRPSYFGLGLALGSGAVRLIDLVNAYASLARGGVWRPWRLVRQAGTGPLPESLVIPGRGQRVLDERVSYIISNILSDAGARTPQFGAHSILSTPYWTAVKTGTSKGFHDNWTVGYTREVTVGVWVGDPAGRPMRGVSGVEGAGHVWRRIMNYVTDRRSLPPDEPADIHHARICPVSGELAGPKCPGAKEELFVAGTEPRAACSFHRHVPIDPQNGLLVPDDCHLDDAELRTVTVYPSPYDAWALAEERGISERPTPRCPRAAAEARAGQSVRLVSPTANEALRIDADTPRQHQALWLAAEAPGWTGSVTFLVDDQPYRTVEAPYEVYWPLASGDHRFRARLGSEGPSSPEHRVIVR